MSRRGPCGLSHCSRAVRRMRLCRRRMQFERHRNRLGLVLAYSDRNEPIRPVSADKSHWSHAATIWLALPALLFPSFNNFAFFELKATLKSECPGSRELLASVQLKATPKSES